MSQGEIEFDKMKTGAPDLNKSIEEQEQAIRQEVNKTLPHLSSEARESIIQSRIGILRNPTRPQIVQVDLGENASRKVKEGLFE